MRKRSREPTVYSVPVQTIQPLSHETCYHVLCQLMKHLLYSRGQTYVPVDQLQPVVQAVEQSRRRRPPASVRKAIKYAQQVSQVMHAIGNIPGNALRLQAFYILFGPSSQRPREVYSIRFHNSSPDAGQAAAPGKAPSEVSRRVLLALMMQHSSIEEWDKVPGPTKMYVMFQADPMEGVPEGFTPRPAFAINLRRAFQVSIDIKSVGPANRQQQQGHQPLPSQIQQPQQQQEQQQQDMVQDMDQDLEALYQQMAHGMRMDNGAVQHELMWYQCTTAVKGLKPPADSG